MYNNIEYNEIKDFINNEIINNKIVNNSKIVSNSLFGGANFKRINKGTLDERIESKNKDKAQSLIAIFCKVLGIKTDSMTYKIAESPELNNTIIVSVGIAVASVIFANKDNLSTQEFFNNIMIVIGLISACLGLTSIIDVIKIGKKILVALNISTGIINEGENAMDDFGKQSDIIDNLNLGGGGIIDNIRDFLNNCWIFVTKLWKDSWLAKKINEIRQWSNSNENDNVAVPIVDEETINRINKIVFEINNIKTSNIMTNYHFDESSGKIIYLGNVNFKEIRTLISFNENYHIKKIQMVTKDDKSIEFLINDNETIIDSITLIQGKPVHTALVFAYVSTQIIISRTESSKYVYNFDDNGKIKVYLKKTDGTIDKEVSTISRAIDAQINNEENKGIEYIKETCQEIFGYNDGLSNETCAKHFYSILGRSAITMIKNIGLEIDKNPNIYDILLSANLGIQYEILKNLNWKIKRNLNNNLELVNADEWLEKVNNSLEYKKYLNEDKPKIKELLNNIVKKINSEPKILNNNKEIETKQIKRRVISKEKLDKIQYISMGENLILNKLVNTNQKGGSYFENVYNRSLERNNNNIEQKYNILKDRLSNINQKLSNITDNKIKSKIQEVKTLQKELELIYNKIIYYIQILKKEKDLILTNKILDINEIDNLINQYNININLQNKKLMILSSAFGKIQISIENNNNNKKGYYHTI
jgi:hypothetical protein